MIKIDLDKILHQRIIDKCLSLYQDSYFPHAAFESMKQVELALKEKTEIKEKLFGKKLIDQLFGSGKGIKLKIPLGDDLQEQGKSFFNGTFSYYRNYTAHDGSKIDEVMCIRIMVIASNLLDIINASAISFEEIGGIKGLIDRGIFNEESQISDLLSFLSSQVFPHEVFDGMFEDLAERSYTDQQYQTIFDLGLIEYKSKISDHGFPGEPDNLDMFGWFELTPKGQMVLDQVQNSSLI